jgi:hypothetical protein
VARRCGKIIYIHHNGAHLPRDIWELSTKLQWLGTKLSDGGRGNENIPAHPWIRMMRCINLLDHATGVSHHFDTFNSPIAPRLRAASSIDTVKPFRFVARQAFRASLVMA